MPPDPFSPQQIAAARGLPNTVEMTGSGSGGYDPITQQVQAAQQRMQMERLQKIQMAELERQQAAEEARARAEQAKADLERARAEAETQELLEHIDQARQARQQSSGGGNDLVGILLTRMMEEQSAARAEAAQLRERITEGLAQQLAEFRADVRRQLAGPEDKRPPASELAEQIGQLTELRSVLAEFLPRPNLVAANGDLDLTIKQLQLQQDFQLRQEQLQMEREARQREWEERREARAMELQLRQQDLLIKQERNDRLGNVLNQWAPRLGDALAGMGTGGAAAAARPPVEKVPDSGGTLHCLDCRTPIPITPGVTAITCPGCGRQYTLQHTPD